MYGSPASWQSTGRIRPFGAAASGHVVTAPSSLSRSALHSSLASFYCFHSPNFDLFLPFIVVPSFVTLIVMVRAPSTVLFASAEQQPMQMLSNGKGLPWSTHSAAKGGTRTLLRARNEIRCCHVRAGEGFLSATLTSLLLRLSVISPEFIFRPPYTVARNGHPGQKWRGLAPEYL
jgi:hypothetical protein